MTDTPTGGEAPYDANAIFSKLWADTLLHLGTLEPPGAFAPKDVTNYHKAVAFLEAVGRHLTPMFEALLAELEDTSGVSNSASLNPSEYITDFIEPEFESTISTLMSESDDDGAEPDPDRERDERDDDEDDDSPNELFGEKDD